MGLMEILNGRIQKVCIRPGKRGEEQALEMGRTYSYRGAWYPWLILACTLSIAGCSFPKIKSSLITGLATTAAVGVTSVLAPGCPCTSRDRRHNGCDCLCDDCGAIC